MTQQSAAVGLTVGHFCCSFPPFCSGHIRHLAVTFCHFNDRSLLHTHTKRGDHNCDKIERKFSEPKVWFLETPIISLWSFSAVTTWPQTVSFVLHHMLSSNHGKPAVHYRTQTNQENTDKNKTKTKRNGEKMRRSWQQQGFSAFLLQLLLYNISVFGGIAFACLLPIFPHPFEPAACSRFMVSHKLAQWDWYKQERMTRILNHFCAHLLNKPALDLCNICARNCLTRSDTKNKKQKNSPSHLLV